MDQTRLKQLLHYDPATGIFTWRIGKQGIRPGTVAGWVQNGYVMICIDGVNYLAHRLAWLYVHGKFPDNEIDHDNGCRSDNRIANLFDRTHAQNLQGFHKPRSNNTSGFRGVRWSERAQGWTGAYMRNGVSHFCGVHNTPEAAFQAISDHKAGKPVQNRADPRTLTKTANLS